jgi:hypothetical protein
MAFTSLRTRLASLPLVLAGPILRKTTEESVTVWLALQASAEVTLRIFKSDAAGSPDLFASAPAKTVRLGRNLHVVCVTARKKADAEALTHNQLYFYDLAVKTAEGTHDLKGATKAADPSVYAYGSHRLPSFVLPPFRLEDLRIFQGSCRKPNSKGVDTLSWLDDFIAEKADASDVRPHLLVMSGDQIYADEVADVLLLMLTDAAQTLMGAPEPLPVPGGAETLGESNPPSTRTQLTKDAKFTTVDRRSHLLSFGEYMAMYLFVWSDVLWPDEVPDFVDVNAVVMRPADKKQLASLAGDLATQRAGVVEFRAGLKKVRRALANIPVYMIFDDHEVTDDWNMTQEFCEIVYGNVLGMRVVQNGLLAYVFCQHWGNAPEQFERPAVGADVLAKFNGAAKYGDIADDELLKRAVGLHTPAQMRAQQPAFSNFHETGTRQQTPGGLIDTKSFLFHYTLEAKNFQLIVTDTRTWRSFPRADAPDLIQEAQIPVQLASTPPLEARIPIIVVSTNMPPCPGIRQATRDLPGIDKDFIYDDLFDSWEIDRVDYPRALAQISRKFPLDDKVHRGAGVLLSGDVHSSSAQRLLYEATAQVGDKAGAPTRAKLVFAQLVGSPLHNQYGKPEGLHRGGYAWVPEKFLARILRQDLLLTEGFVGWNPVTTKDEDIVAIIFMHDKFVLHGDYEMIYRGDHANYTTRKQELPHVWEKEIKSLKKPPDFRMRLDYLRSVRRSSNFVNEPLTESEKFKKKHGKATAWRKYLESRDGREIVGRSNIGEFSFKKASAPPVLSVVYRIHFEMSANRQWHEHVVSLDIDDDKYPIAKDPGVP